MLHGWFYGFLATVHRHMQPQRTALFTRSTAALCLVALTTSSVHAQPAQSMPALVDSPAVTDAARAAPAEARRLLAHQLTILMAQSLAGEDRPQPRLDQFQRARTLLEMALTLAPNDAELWALRVELAGHMNEEAAQRRALQRYVSLRPADDAAQWRLIQSYLRAIQTLDNRLDRVEGMLRSRSGRQFSRPLRSRLATYAARAANELGRTNAFGNWLSQAVALDPANPEAAAMVYQLAMQQGVSMAQVGSAAITAVAAAPADPAARLRLAEVLLSQGVYDQAASQYDTAAMLAQSWLPTDAYADWALSLAAQGNDEQALAVLRDLEPGASQSRGQSGQESAAADNEEGPSVEPTLPAELELLRLAILDSTPGRDDLAEHAYRRLRRQLEQRIARAEQEADEGQAGEDEASDVSLAAEAAAQARADLAWAQLLFDRDVDRAADAIQQLSESEGAVADRLPRLRAWLALRREQQDAAREALTEQLENDPFAALGLAALVADPTRQHELLALVVERSPSSLAGLLAARQASVAGQPVTPTRTGHTLVARMGDHPGHLWRPALSISPWAALELNVQPMAVSYLEPLRTELTLRNASQMPLTLATGEGIPTRVLLSVSPSVAGSQLSPPAPIVVDVDRRLTLGVGEAFSTVVRLDQRGLGAMLAARPHETVTMNVTATLGPQPMRSGGFIARPEGDTARRRSIVVRGQTLDQTSLDQWIQSATDGDDAATQMRALARLAQSLDMLPDAMDDAQTRQRIGSTINSAFPSFDPVRQAWVARFLPRTEGARQPFRRAFDLLKRTDDPMVRIVYLATHVNEPNDPVLTASLRHDDRTIRAFAEALHDGLQVSQQQNAPDADGADEANE